MICPKCGSEVSGGKFCSECGAPLPSLDQNGPKANDCSIADFSHLGDEKYYKKDEKVIRMALSHHVFVDPEKVIMYAGNYYSNLNSYFLFVNLDELIFCVLNEKKPEDDTITRFDYSDSHLDALCDKNHNRINLDEATVGFKPNKIIVYPKQLQVIYNEVQRLSGKEFESSLIPDTEDQKKGFWQQMVEDGRKYNQQKQLQQSAHPNPPTKKERVKQNRANGIACCPKCGSTSLSANKKGFGIGKALVGASVTMGTPLGPLGAVAGNIGAKKVVVTCLNCGHQWKI